MVCFEDRRFAQGAMLDLLKRKPDLADLYVPSGGIEGIVASLRDGRPARPDVVVAMLDRLDGTRPSPASPYLGFEVCLSEDI